jgi:hypothetical protein
MKGLEFEDAGRTFSCESATSPATPGTLWWWVTISGESQRYAAFRVEPTDTPASLRSRVLAYYAQLLADRARPHMPRASWAGRRQAGAGTAGTTAQAADATSNDKSSS